MKLHELDALIDDWFEGRISESDAAKLSAELEQSAASRAHYWETASVHGLLEHTMQQASLRSVTGQVPPIPPKRIQWLGWRSLAAAAVVVFTGIWAWLMWKPSHPATVSPLASLAAANDAVWADPNVELALRSGELPQGALRLESGTAEFLCMDGATVVIRGPASVRFMDLKRVFVEDGRIFCRCPSPESRLSIVTPATEIQDLGTEFTVEARADQSTLVAVLSGEVQVGKTQTQLLRKGQSAVVRGDGLLVIQPLAQEDFSELLLASPTVNDAIRHGRNLLADPGFEQGLREQTWSGTEPNLAASPSGGRSGGAVRIRSNGQAHWPQCRQKIATGDIAGRLVVGTVWAAPSGGALRSKQSAVLKIVFVNDKGRDFAFAMRRFLDAKSSPDRFEQAQVAALAPPGTRSVQLQLMFQTNLRESGSILFDDAALMIADSEIKQDTSK